MRRLSKPIAAFAAASIAIPAVALAQDQIAIVQLDLNLRAGPAPTYPILTAIPSQQPVTIIGCLDDRTWCDVVWADMRGWVYAPYLTYQTVALPQAPPAQLPPPVIFEAETYWTQHYQDQPFFPERDRWFGAAGGAAGGAVLGALVFGPVGAAVGAAVGGAAGAAVGEAITPPEQVVTYMVAQQPQPVYLQGEVVVGAVVPPVVTLQPVPDYNYASAYINGQWVLVDPASRQIVFVLR